MAEILGLGCTHWPTLCLPNERLTDVLQPGARRARMSIRRARTRRTGRPSCSPNSATTTASAAAQRCGERFGNDFRAMRKILDDFNPDFVLVWGDDQYENFKEDIVPPFCVLGYDDEFDLQPWRPTAATARQAEPLGRARRLAMQLNGHREAAKHIATGLIERGIDMAYAYKPLHHPMAHAFTNTFLYLDWDRQGFPYPVVPFAINCYGRNLIHAKGGFGHLFVPPRPEGEPGDPPSPQPWRCMDVGAAVAEVLARSPYRVALVASSSLVALLPVAEERLSVARPRGRPHPVRCARARRLRHLAQALAGRDGVFRAARDAELDGADRRDGGARPEAGDPGLHGDLHPGLGQMLRVVPGVSRWRR